MDENAVADFGYSQAIRAEGLLFCAGQIGIELDGSVPEDPARQYALAFAALKEVLASEGCRPADIVDLTTFHRNFPDHMDEFIKTKAEFLGDARPAWTAIGVAALGHAATLVEIKAVARAS